MLRFAITIATLCALNVSFAANPEPSDYRIFTDKHDQQIEARILSISPDRKTMKMQRQDGNVFSTAVTILSLDDQQFIHDWLTPNREASAGKIRFFGEFFDGEGPKLERLAGEDEFVSLQAAKTGWIALLPSGKTVARYDPFDGLDQVSHFYANTDWVAITKDDGAAYDGRLTLLHPDILTGVKQVTPGAGHSAALMSDGGVKVWGRPYPSDSVSNAPGNLTAIIKLASTQGAMAALDRDGNVYGWKPGINEVNMARLGEGIVDIEGSIFNHLALTKSGEVYEWNKPDPNAAKIPNAIKGEGPFIKIRCNGNTRAVQREDGTWLAWGTNGSGIVDHINSLGPVPDLVFFSVPSKDQPAYVIWIEP